MGKIVRSFEVRANKKALVNDLARDLDSKLCELQREGWTILNVVSTPCIEWDYPKYFDSMLFTIIAEHEKIKYNDKGEDDNV